VSDPVQDEAGVVPAPLGTAAPSAAGPGLYLHLPFCSAVCPYCDFAVAVASAPRRRRFTEVLLAEIDLCGGAAAPYDTVYLGGGTPSMLPPESLARLLAVARERLGVVPEAWIYLEANPEDVTPAAVAAWRRLGVRTLSLGVQSFDAAELAFLGRHHDPGEARRAVEEALAAGFPTVSLDLIYGLPGQGPAAWRRNLEAAVSLGPHHLSCYQLTIEEGTPFGLRRRRGALVELAEEGQAELFTLTHAFLADAGYPAYEVSNFARAPAHRSRHNQKYWDHTPYLGLGPSAHSFDGDRRRWWNEARLSPYQRRVAAGERPLAGEEILSPAQLALEAVMLGLRRTAGIDLARFAARHGCDLVAANSELVEELIADGLLTLANHSLAPTARGLAVADALARRFTLPPT
jgi:putative oxygen-independent coproporphyrinogen III oxidase